MAELKPLIEIDTALLADWLDTQEGDTWWNVDGVPELTDSLRLPCPADELASVLRRLAPDKLSVLGTADETPPAERGVALIDGLVRDEGGARVLYLTWKESDAWVLAEDVGVKQALDAAATA